MVNYYINIEKAKAKAICRLCKKDISIREVRVQTGGSDGYNNFSQCMHTDCFLRYIIKEIKNIKQKELKQELESFDKIEKLLGEQPKKKKRIKKQKIFTEAN